VDFGEKVEEEVVCGISITFENKFEDGDKLLTSFRKFLLEFNKFGLFLTILIEQSIQGIFLNSTVFHQIWALKNRHFSRSDCV
tara:strand:- start:959 stop:1207 length:249 start_codon:yes stop_codon:yes gene_type:complete